MLQHIFRTKEKRGLPPGSVIYLGKERNFESSIDLYHYSESGIRKESCATKELDYVKDGNTQWYNMIGVHDVEMINAFGKVFKLHPLALEDIANTEQRPRLEDYDDQLFISFKMLRFDQDSLRLSTEQVTFILLPECLLTFQEEPGDVFGYVRNRLEKGVGKIRKAGPSYLLYALLDAIVDHYFVVMESIGEKVQLIESSVLNETGQDILKNLAHLRTELLNLRRLTTPSIEVFSQIDRKKFDLIDEANVPYFRDVYDHLQHISDWTETYRQILATSFETNLANLSQRLNEVMRVLTIFASIFIPLTFVAGIYGMNFDHMPELHFKWGYFGALGLMAAMTVGMLGFFKYKKWI